MQRTAIITGATRGIGRGLFERLLAENVRIATVYHRDEQSAALFRADALKAGVKCRIDCLDLGDLNRLPAFVEDVHREFGRIDYLINGAGVDVFKTTFDTSLEEWRLSQDIMLNAPFVLCRAALPFMRAQGFGRIINIGASSKDYFKGTPGLTPFGVHKAALAIFTKSLALEEIRNGITVNMVAPGSTAGAGTNPEERRIPVTQIPIGRRVAVDEVVDAIMYFLSDGAGVVTGQFLGVNGGLST